MQDRDSETADLAHRFLRVLEALGKLTHYRMPEPLERHLALNQLKALHCVYHNPGLSQRELAENLAVTPAAISTAVRDMEALRLLERRECEDDTRMKRLFLSEYGRRLIDGLRAQRHEAAAGLLGALSPDERRLIVELLERAMSAMQKTDYNTSA